MAILIPKPFSDFQKLKKQTQKDPFKIQKSKISLKSINVRKLTPPKVAILIPKPFLKFQKVKKQTQSWLKIKVVQISNFSKFKVQSVDIATLLGAEGPQKGPKGPRGPKGPPQELEGWECSTQIF